METFILTKNRVFFLALDMKVSMGMCQTMGIHTNFGEMKNMKINVDIGAQNLAYILKKIKPMNYIMFGIFGNFGNFGP